MEGNYIQLPYEVTSKDELKLKKSIDLITAIDRNPYVKLCEVRRDQNDEIVIIDMDIEVGQYPVYDIHHKERIAIKIWESDDRHPEVLALREDFPLVPHLNLRKQERPRSLCISEDTYEEVRIRWSAFVFLDQIRKWLYLTARNELHRHDQPLEPLLLPTATTMILPHDLFTKLANDGSEMLLIDRINCGDRVTLQGEIAVNEDLEKEAGAFLGLIVKGTPQIHGIISRQPSTLMDLASFLTKAEVALIEVLRTNLKQLSEKRKKGFYDLHPIVIAELPKIRTINEKVESYEYRAFLLDGTVKDLGIDIGLWDVNSGVPGLLLSPDSTKKGDGTKITGVLNVQFTLSRSHAAVLNGIEPYNKSGVFVGVGALGSQILINLARCGYGSWTVIDKDIYLPHNATRHALHGLVWGVCKAEMVGFLANNILAERLVTQMLAIDLLKSKSSDEVVKIFNNSHIIIDTSASLEVSRAIAREFESPARRISAFLNPCGYDSVLLVEDSERKVRLDSLEMQYYRYLIETNDLEKHLQLETGARVRYARSCGDITTIMPQEIVAIHSAVIARALRHAIDDPKPCISIWKSDPNTLELKRYFFEPEIESFEIYKNGWTLCYDKKFIDKVQCARKMKLPKETGGILVGSYDLGRKIIYVVDTVLSPSDSLEQPTCYIRGIEGLRQEVNRIETVTANMLTYIGEWHSHPEECSTRPSTDDAKVFQWLNEILGSQGFPPLMLIVGGNSDRSWYVDKLE